ncbi:ABC transporter ATP-binding protein [Nocardioides pantholopis]|uniref:ABC transporter ATP-binding protein n=1 Tax=Nocardioides pantholopis TaxID=2483798 RepID=UPI000F08176A|nr:ABC transporter ATP-binding protein [Nocardioides pantholopis]
MTRLPVSSAAEAAGLARTLLMRRRGAFVASAVMFALVGLAGLVAPWQLGRVADLVSTGGSTRDVLSAAAWIGGAAVVGAVATALSVSTLARAGEPALAELREQVLDRALHLETEELEAAGQGDLMSRVGDDVRVVAGSLTEAVPLLVNSVVTIVFTVGGLAALDWRLGLAGLAAAPFYAVALRWYLPRSGPYYRREREANGDRAEALLTGVHGSRTLRAFGLAEEQQRTVDRASWRSASLSIDVFDLLMRFGGRNNRAEAVGLLLVLSTGFALVRADAATVGAVTAAALYFHRLFNPVGAVLFLFDEVQSAGASLTRLAGIALLPAPARGGGTAPAHRGVAVTAVSHEYDAEHPALRGVDLEVAEGERLAVVGASGAGKSTLGLVVAGRLVPTSGSVTIGGVEVRAAALADRPVVATVTQEIHVLAGSVADNLLLARPSATRAELEAALRSVGAADWVAALPEGLDTEVGAGTVPLTPAQAQQLALARVLVADPWVVVLDEATAEAGSAGARVLEEAALAATEGRTTITIAHRLVQARSADRVLVLEAGEPVELGGHDELVRAGGRYARLWAAWSQD